MTLPTLSPCATAPARTRGSPSLASGPASRPWMGIMNQEVDATSVPAGDGPRQCGLSSREVPPLGPFVSVPSANFLRSISHQTNSPLLRCIFFLLWLSPPPQPPDLRSSWKGSESFYTCLSEGIKISPCIQHRKQTKATSLPALSVTPVSQSYF